MEARAKTHSVDVNSDLELDDVSSSELGDLSVGNERREVGDDVVDGEGGGESDT